MDYRPRRVVVTLFAACTLASTACLAGGAADGSGGEPARPLAVVASTTLVADVVANIAGDAVTLTVLLVADVDPHAFEPSPRDAAAVADADVVFVNGLGLEVFLDSLFANARGAEIVAVSDGIPDVARNGAQNGSPAADPHVWFDPNNVIVWTQNVERTLRSLDPANAGAYGANAERYRAELRALDAWIEAQVAQIPASDRKLVTDHDVFGYFGRRYDFELVGAVIPGFSTVHEPSAQQIAALEDAVRQLGAKAIFVGTTVNPGLAARLAEDTGVRLVPVYTEALSAPDGPAGSYMEFMRYNVTAIVDALN